MDETGKGIIGGDFYTQWVSAVHNVYISRNSRCYGVNRGDPTSVSIQITYLEMP